MAAESISFISSGDTGGHIKDPCDAEKVAQKSKKLKLLLQKPHPESRLSFEGRQQGW